MQWSFRNPDDYPHGVYRIYNFANAVIYIGVSIDPDSRIKNGHAHTARWFGEYDRHDVTWYDTRAEAETAETSAIKSEKPRYNVLHNDGRSHKPHPGRVHLTLDPRSHGYLKMFAIECGPGVRGAQVMRALLDELAEDPDLAVRVSARMSPS